jgi:hypothetical protein
VAAESFLRMAHFEQLESPGQRYYLERAQLHATLAIAASMLFRGALEEPPQTE